MCHNSQWVLQLSDAVLKRNIAGISFIESCWARNCIKLTINRSAWYSAHNLLLSSNCRPSSHDPAQQMGLHNERGRLTIRQTGEPFSDATRSCSMRLFNHWGVHRVRYAQVFSPTIPNTSTECGDALDNKFFVISVRIGEVAGLGGGGARFAGNAL